MKEEGGRKWGEGRGRRCQRQLHCNGIKHNEKRFLESVADLQRRGAVITHAPLMSPYGLREFVVEDLNGYRLAFGESAP